MRARSSVHLQFDSWWPPSHHIGKADLSPRSSRRAGGRWYEKGVDGSEGDWGARARVSRRRGSCSWHLNGQWEVDNDPAHGSEIEVRFTPDGDARTIIHFEHRHIEAQRLRRAAACRRRLTRRLDGAARQFRREGEG